MPRTRLSQLPVVVLGALALAACSPDGQSAEDPAAENAVEDEAGTVAEEAEGDDADDTGEDTEQTGDVADFNDADVEQASELVSHHLEGVALADLALEQGTDQVSGIAGEMRSFRVEEVEYLSATLERYGEPVPEDDGEPDQDLAGSEGDDFDIAWLDRVESHLDESVTLTDEQLAEGIDLELSGRVTDMRERIDQERSDVAELREALGG